MEELPKAVLDVRSRTRACRIENAILGTGFVVVVNTVAICELRRAVLQTPFIGVHLDICNGKIQTI
jgi:hypothetical protein